MDISTLQPGDVVDVQYANSSLAGGRITDTVTVDRVEGGQVVSTNGYRYDRDTVVKKREAGDVGPARPAPFFDLEPAVTDADLTMQNLQPEVLRRLGPGGLLDRAVRFAIATTRPSHADNVRYRARPDAGQRPSTVPSDGLAALFQLWPDYVPTWACYEVEGGEHNVVTLKPAPRTERHAWFAAGGGTFQLAACRAIVLARMFEVRNGRDSVKEPEHFALAVVPAPRVQFDQNPEVWAFIQGTHQAFAGGFHPTTGA